MCTKSNENQSMPLVARQPVSENDSIGKFVINWVMDFPKSAIAFWGDVDEYSLLEMNWLYVISYSYVKENERITISSTDEYPIFARKCYYENGNEFQENFFFKIYEPYAIKQYRYRYVGNLEERPRHYINGLHELKKMWQRRLRCNSSISELDKIDNAAFCTSEEQAVQLHSLDVMPLWFNSETFKANQEDIQEISQYVKNLFFIPKLEQIDMNNFQGEMSLLSD